MLTHLEERLQQWHYNQNLDVKLEECSSLKTEPIKLSKTSERSRLKGSNEDQHVVKFRRFLIGVSNATYQPSYFIAFFFTSNRNPVVIFVPMFIL